MAGVSRCCGTHVRMRQWYTLCVYQLELQHAYHQCSSTHKDINPARPTIELLGSVPVRATLQRNLSAFSATVVSCVRSDQPPRYQDTQPFARLAGGSLQSKTTCSSKFVGWNLAFIPRSSCLHEGSTRAVRNSDLAALGQTANKLPINSPCQ